MRRSKFSNFRMDLYKNNTENTFLTGTRQICNLLNCQVGLRIEVEISVVILKR